MKQRCREQREDFEMFHLDNDPSGEGEERKSHREFRKAKQFSEEDSSCNGREGKRKRRGIEP